MGGVGLGVGVVRGEGGACEGSGWKAGETLSGHEVSSRWGRGVRASWWRAGKRRAEDEWLRLEGWVGERVVQTAQVDWAVVWFKLHKWIVDVGHGHTGG